MLWVVNVNASSSMVGILINSVLHLAQEVVNVDEILLSASIGHRQIVLLSQGVLAGGRASVDNGGTSGLRHVMLLRSGHGSVGDGQRAVERHQRAADLSIRRGIDLTALGTAEEVIDHVESALAVITTRSGAVAQMLSSGVVQGRLVEVEAVVC